jgi:hypothetical protein
MIHRHLEYPVSTPPDELPSAAIVDLLDRGDLEDWRPLARAIARDPQGELAERVASLVDAYPKYGTSPLWRAFLDRCRARVGGETSQPVTTELAGLRRRREITQVEVARRLRISQSDVSKLERRRDLRVSTLRDYAEAIGGRLRLLVVFSDGEVEVRKRWPQETRRRRVPGREPQR